MQVDKLRVQCPCRYKDWYSNMRWKLNTIDDTSAMVPTNRAKTTAPMVNQLVWPAGASGVPVALNAAFHRSVVVNP